VLVPHENERELIGSGERHGPQKEGIHDRKHRRGHADGQREHPYCSYTSTGPATEASDGIAGVLAKRIQKRTGFRVTDLLFNSVNAAKRQRRRATGALKIHASGKVLLDEQVERRANLVIEVTPNTCAMNDVAIKAGDAMHQ
jgi:hypothetical protein